MIFFHYAPLLCVADAVLTVPLKKTTDIPEVVLNRTLDGTSNLADRLLQRRNADPNTALKNQGFWFQMELAFGSSKKVLPAFLDTGSSDTWVADSLWDPSESDTDINLNQDRESCYGSGECIRGYMVQDTLWIGDNEVSHSNFMVDTTSVNSEHALIGLSWTNYDNFPYTVKTSGLSYGVAYSIWLNGDGKGDGSICFGGIDQTKFKGQIGIVQNRDTPDFDSNGNEVVREPPTKLTTPLNGISVKAGDSRQKVVDSSIAVWFDTGTYQAWLPRDWIEAIGAAWGCEWDDNYEAVMCGYDPTGSVIFDFSGVEVELDVSKLVYGVWDKTGDHWDWGFLFSEDTNHLEADSNLMFGNVWQRYVYIVYDMEHRNIGFAAALTGDESNQVHVDDPILEIRDSVPNAYTGANYGTSYHTNSWVQKATRVGTHTYTPISK